MCVIFVASKARPTDEMVERAWDHNKDGGGIAWRNNGRVVWKKGIMTLAEMKEICQNTPLPYAAHFRVASVGGVKQSLTHPFLVGREGALELEGSTDGSVLFHNGHWNQWNDKALDAAIHTDNLIPEGPDWSDSRAMAWMISIYGNGLMDLLTGQKGVIMTPKKFNIYVGNGGWTKINDVWCSNDYFWSGRPKHGHNAHGHYTGYTSQRLCSLSRCTNKVTGNKDICDSCLETRRKESETISADTNVGQSQSLAIVRGGDEKSGPLARVFAMQEVNNFRTAGLISKNLWKKYQKANSSKHASGGKGHRAMKNLVELSETIAEKLIAQAGSVN